MHAGEQPMHTVSAIGVQGIAVYDDESQTVHAAQLVPLPVNPGLHAHCTVPEISMQNASALQPPLFVAHAPTGTAVMH
jgi:hypothetical protein